MGNPLYQEIDRLRAENRRLREAIIYFLQPDHTPTTYEAAIKQLKSALQDGQGGEHDKD